MEGGRETNRTTELEKRREIEIKLKTADDHSNRIAVKMGQKQ